MMTNNRRSAPVINVKLPIREAWGEYSFDCTKLNKMATLGSIKPIEEPMVHFKNRWMSLISSSYSSFTEYSNCQMRNRHRFFLREIRLEKVFKICSGNPTFF
jgi:hypothetical protein